MPWNTLQTNPFLVLKETFILYILSYYTYRTSVYELLIIMIVTFRLISLYDILVHGYSYHNRFSFFTRKLGNQKNHLKRKNPFGISCQLVIPVQTHWICLEEMQFYPSHQIMNCSNCMT